jgi:hypothetical protein
MSTRTGENQHELDILNKKSELKLQEMKWQTIHLLVMCIGGIICVLIVCLTQDGFESSECLL